MIEVCFNSIILLSLFLCELQLFIVAKKCTENVHLSQFHYYPSHRKRGNLEMCTNVPLNSITFRNCSVNEVFQAEPRPKQTGLESDVGEGQAH